MYEIRPYQGRDEADLLNVWTSAATHDPISAALFRTKVLLDPNFLPSHLPVAVARGKVVGFALGVTRQVPLASLGLEPKNAWVTAFGVHPEYRCHGIGTALFRQLLDQFESEGRSKVGISPYVPNYFVPGVDVEAYPETVRWLEALGFESLYRAISMGADLTGFQIPSSIIELEERLRSEHGVTIDPVSGGDIPDLMPFIAENFGWDWHRHAQDYLLEYFGAAPGHICFLVARQHGTVVGFCQQRHERFGPFGVTPAKRNLGIGRVLLFRCLAEMRAKHNFYAYFLWTGDDAARLYSTAGFKRRRAFAVLQKTLEGALED
jgi:mycothiol synthase